MLDFFCGGSVKRHGAAPQTKKLFKINDLTSRYLKRRMEPGVQQDFFLVNRLRLRRLKTDAHQGETLMMFKPDGSAE
ncbi:hypothetical protein [Leisingera sp. ANG-M7]|uniref:hypothetical protein n=1 Tax=Leisingera sp. ANG-M7 TaxID=1577902 RepID=UPI001269A686|nr:hypothetical protein [Leisingera sp. ANG-M7]